MTDPLRIVQLNLAYSPALETPSALVNTYHTLTGWADAIDRAGADVVTVQRYAVDADVTHGRCRVLFVRDEGASVPNPWASCRGALDAVIALQPDVVHVNGLMFPGAIRALRQRLPPTAPIAVQDHSGSVPRPWPSPFDWVRRRRWHEAFGCADAFAFTARELAQPWHAVGLPRDAAILEVPEAGTAVAPLPHEKAMTLTGVRGSPAILWVGRLDRNKDPMTVLSAIEMAMPRLADGRTWMIYGEAPLEAAVAERIATSAALRDRVTLVGAVPHEQMAPWFSAADVFVSGSHHEGSGYALIEAMACGVMPCVTSIPAFRALTRGRGALWTVGDADACAAALVDLAARDRAAERVAIRQHFADALSWERIGRLTVDHYRALVVARQRRAAR